MRRLIRSAARLAYRARGYQPTRIGRERFKMDPYHIGFWRDVSRGGWEPQTFRFLERSLRPDSVFADIGAWIGPTTLFAARRCRRVYSFEPDYDAYRYLLWNLQLNGQGNTVPFPFALGATTGMRPLWSAEARLGTSQSSLLAPAAGNVVAAEQPAALVCAMAWSDWLKLMGPGRIDCVKMDIEGGEFELLPAMREYLAAERPALHLSLHAGLLPERERDSRLAEIVDLLRVYPDWRNDAGESVTPEGLRRLARSGDCALQLSGAA